MIFHSTSKKPILVVGSGLRSAEAIDLLREFARKTSIPVLTTMNAVDLIPDDMRIGFIGVYGNRIANMIVAECDLVIAIGARLGLRQIGHRVERFAPKARLIRADIDQYELSRFIKENEEKYLMDAREFLQKLLDEEIPSYQEWRNRCFDAKRVLDDFDKEPGNLAMEKIASVLPPNPIVAIDVGQNECWAAQSLVIKGQNGRIFINGGYGSMGCALPIAIGASIANNREKTFCITGDGGLQMNIQELETVTREKLPIKIIVVNNHVLGKISEIQCSGYDSRYAQTTKESGYSVPDFVKIAEAYGIRATELPYYDLLSNYTEWLNDEEACLINLHIPSDSKLIPKINWETGKIKPELDNDVIRQVETILDC